MAIRGTKTAPLRVGIIAVGALWALVTLTVGAPSPARAEGAFTAGTGAAKASLITPTVAAGNLAVTVLVGESSANFRDRSGVGQSILLDVPALRITSGGTVCGRVGFDIGAALPPHVVADTAANQDTKPVDAASTTGGQLIDQTAHAAPEASASSSTGIGTIAFGPIVTVLASRADTATSADAKKQVRRAAAHTAIGDVALLGGIITIHGLRWDLEQTITGADGRADQEHVDAGFTFANISVGLPGLPLVTIPVPTPAQLPAVMTQVNGILGPLGLQLRLPTVGGNPDARSHTVSPLTLAIGGRSSILGPVIGTLANDPSFQELTRLLGKTLFDAKDCKELGGLLSVLSPELDATYNTLGGSYPLLVAVITGALGGTGEVQLNIGGVETRIDDEYFPPLSFAPPGPGAPTPGFAGTPAVPGRLGGPGVTTPGRPPAPGGSTQALVSTKTVCRTTSPADRPGCWLGHGPVAAALAGLFTLGLLGLDEGLRRRRMSAAHEEKVLT